MILNDLLPTPPLVFQCSSASRKFLNADDARQREQRVEVSVLFSEPKIPQCILRDACAEVPQQVSVLFSEPKIPQLHRSSLRRRFSRVSVLFSEPKIPQCSNRAADLPGASRFSALQRAENSSIIAGALFFSLLTKFQCSSASRKFLNHTPTPHPRTTDNVSVLFSEPKIPQSRPSHLRPSIFPTATITLRRS